MCSSMEACSSTQQQQQQRCWQHPGMSQLRSGRRVSAPQLTALAVLLLAAAAFVVPAAAVTTQIPAAHIHAQPHHTGCGKGVPCPDEPAAHQAAHHPVTARHAHYSGGAQQHHPATQHQHIKGASSVAAVTANGAHFDTPGHHHPIHAAPGGSGSHNGAHDAAAAPQLTAQPSAIGPDGKPTSCHSWGSEAHKETEEDKLDRPYGIDPETGLAPTEEDAAEAEILHEAKQAGMDPLNYAAQSDEATHTVSHADVYADAASHSAQVQESLERGFRLSYTFHVWFKTSHSPHEGDVALLTQFSSASNHGLLDNFGSSLKAAVHELLPEGIAELRTINWIPGNPLEVELVVYPDLLIPDELNPARVLQQTDHAMAVLHTKSLSPEFREQWLIDEVQVQPMPDNEREIEDAWEMFGSHDAHHDETHQHGHNAHQQHDSHHPDQHHTGHHYDSSHYDSHHNDHFDHDDHEMFHGYYGHEHGQHHSSSGMGLSGTVALLLFVVCPMLAAAALAGHALLKRYSRSPARRMNKMLPKYPGFEKYPMSSKPGCGSSGGLGSSSSSGNIAAVYAAPLEYYAGPYRNVYSSSGGGSSATGSSARSSIPGSQQQQQGSPYVTPASTDGGAQL